MLTDVMTECKNHFAKDKFGNFFFPSEQGKFKIQNEILTGVKDAPLVGSYFAITGSVLNNGVYLPINELITLAGGRNEEFEGVIYRLVVPRDFIELAERIEVFTQSSAGQASNIVSASFGIQSQSFGVDSNGVRAGWQTVFRQELNKYRRMTPDIVI